jgi:hypothetical protein
LTEDEKEESIRVIGVWENVSVVGVDSLVQNVQGVVVERHTHL